MIGIHELPPLDPHAGQTVVSQLADVLVGAIQAGRYEPGDRLPGISALRERYAVSAETVLAAFRMVILDGFAVERPGSGLAGLFVRGQDGAGLDSQTLRQVIALVMAAGGEIRVPDALLEHVDGKKNSLWMIQDHGSDVTVFRVGGPTWPGTGEDS